MNLRQTRLISLFYLVALTGIICFSAVSMVTEYNKGLAEKAAMIKSAADPNLPTPLNSQTTANTEPTGIPIFSQVIQSTASYSSPEFTNTVSEIFFRLFMAVFLTMLLACRPKKSIPLFQRNFHVIQTQILLAVVAASLMMIVGNNAARAFAIFAAVSLVRFRTNIKNPKEVTVLLVSLAIGLASGVGYWQLGMILCFFVMILLWFLEYNEDENSFRSMELTVRTSDTNKTQLLLKDIFIEHSLESELRRIDVSEEQKKAGKITYFVNLPLDLSTDYITEEIIYGDNENSYDVKWDHKPKALQIYE